MPFQYHQPVSLRADIFSYQDINFLFNFNPSGKTNLFGKLFVSQSLLFVCPAFEKEYQFFQFLQSVLKQFAAVSIKDSCLQICVKFKLFPSDF